MDWLKKMDWIQTFTGKQFFPLNPRGEDIDIRDIAHSLAMQCRFNGHCLKYYSVAEHSVRLSLMLPKELALWGLLHDAGEAYLCDLPRPLKHQMPSYFDFEDKLLSAVAQRFDLPYPIPQPVFDADNTMLATEARDLMADPPVPWNLPYEPLPEPIPPMRPAQAEQEFLYRFAQLVV